MQLGMVGAGRMGGNMIRRLLGKGHDCVVFDASPEAVAALAGDGAVGATSLADLVSKLTAPRTVWLMVPAAAVDATITKLAPLLAEGDTIIDGGNSYYVDDLRRAATLERQGIHFVDVGTSGGVWGRERGYCQMIGGEAAVVERLHPIFAALAPSRETASATPGREPGTGTAERGFLHCGPAGAGHFVKMVHNGIEYGVMAAYAEGLNILKHANVGRVGRARDAETAPLAEPAHYQYELDVAEITELWRRGSVLSSWLLDLTAAVLHRDPELERFAGRVADSGEGRWTLRAAIDEAVPAPVLSSALFERFASRGEAGFANRVLSAMRFAFGGHAEKR